MTGRKQAQAATRSRAVAAACQLLSAERCEELTFESVARASGLTRVTLYNHFGSRSELLLAVFEELGRRMHAERIRDAMRDADPKRAIERLFVESTRAWQRQRRAVARVFALSTFDPDVRGEVARAERARRESLGFLARRLSEAGALGPAVSCDEAATILGSLTSFQAFEAFAGAGTALTAQRLLGLGRRGLGLRASKTEGRGRGRR